ncbi:MAG: hypothetical protein QNJ46_14960 [Leptolyngbyaceae cyanobacterium MO_188.B28]|nr:hypothetical protein [Leptolyngbyaceae cyanobacterium MO_188.B28]
MGEVLIPNYVSYLVPNGVTYLIATLCIGLLVLMVVLDVMSSETSH